MYRIPKWVVERSTWRSMPRHLKHASGVTEITVDWDRVAPREAEVVRNLLLVSGVASLASLKIAWRRSSSGHVHLRVGFPYELNPGEAFYEREQLADDPIRLKFDAYRYWRTRDPIYARGILFDSKVDGGLIFETGAWHPLPLLPRT